MAMRLELCASWANQAKQVNGGDPGWSVGACMSFMPPQNVLNLFIYYTPPTCLAKIIHDQMNMLR